MTHTSGSGTVGAGSGEPAPVSQAPYTELVPPAGVAASSPSVRMTTGPDELHAEARRRLESASCAADFAAAKQVLLRALAIDPGDPEGKTRYLLGLVCFHQQDWANAETYLVASLGNMPNPLASQLLERVRTNRNTGIERTADPLPDFKPGELRKPAALALRAPMTSGSLSREPKEGLLMRLLDTAVGRVLGLVVKGAAALVYSWQRDRTKIYAFENWDRLSTLPGLLYLGAIRHGLNGDKLQSTYTGVLVGDQPPGQTRPEWTERFRTATGAWTTDDPMEGAAGTEIQRSGSPLARRTNRVGDRLPSPRDVSRFILAPHAGRPRQEVPFLNLLTIAWIQAELHDWVSHRPTPVPGVHTVPLAQDDPLRGRYGIGALQVHMSVPNPMDGAKPLTYLNEVTHWWDASQIYGSDQNTQDRLRADADGKLRIEQNDLLPLNPDTRIEDSGFTRNWWVGLDIIHTLFVKHHNFICEELKKEYPTWTSDELFHTARLINAAIMAKIHTVEWTPAVLPNRKLVTGMAVNWWGLIETWRRPVHLRRTYRRWEPIDPVLGGIAGGERDNHAKPYGLSEEFTEVYRLHAGIPDAITMSAPGPASSTTRIATEATRGEGARPMVQNIGMATLLNSFGHQHMPALVNNNYPAFMCEMSVPGQPVIDIGTIDILRARERGVPPYNEFRRMLDLIPITRFEDLGCSAETVQTLEQLYGAGEQGIEKLDLLAGTSCELWRPENFGFGETMFTVFIQMASRRLEADPFYTAKFNARYYTRTGMALVERATLKSVLLQHYPELERYGLGNVENAFEPWGTTAATHPAEHPLAQMEHY